ncbi:hypothetical protein [Planomonospora venezuelensis]|uniref:DUF3558 domain-containing protein n=1 Tax=Planomonospora venezuelensis TaxID=1999 RepID=A0A841CXN6_PLAVE|nr:hypothetical protein [Planomonospora venezuelensis]MBB5963162.1 hypothetical protein [Planomonospora venezuelensis]GIN00038.1 hypothetical protein Pve01_16960 [Planomonospora venezuelensis]
MASPPSPPYPAPPPAGPRRRWIAPVVAGAAALAVTGGVAVHLATRPGPAPFSGSASAGASGDASASPAALTPPGAPDVCAMIGGAETGRLILEPEVERDSSDDSGRTTWSCRWSGDFTSSGGRPVHNKITITVVRHKGDQDRSAVAAAQGGYGFDLQNGRRFATAPPEGYRHSRPVQLTGVGDGAHVRFSRPLAESGGITSAEGFSRVGDVTVAVKYDRYLRGAPAEPGLEKDALREAGLLLRQATESAAAWREGRPYARPTAVPERSPTPAPTATPTPTPVPIAVPPACTALAPAVTRLVPRPKTGAGRTREQDRTTVTCWWENPDIRSPGGLSLRAVSVSFTSFADRAGGPDHEAARLHYAERYARAVRLQREGRDPAYPGVSYGSVAELRGLGERAYSQYRRHRTPDLYAGAAGVLVLSGSTVIEIVYAGSERPEGRGVDSPRSVLLPLREAVTGVTPLAGAVVRAFRQAEPG